jgi:hypothetical protein
MFDLIVSGGTAVMPAGAEAADIGVAGGKQRRFVRPRQQQGGCYATTASRSLGAVR